MFLEKVTPIFEFHKDEPLKDDKKKDLISSGNCFGISFNFVEQSKTRETVVEANTTEYFHKSMITRVSVVCLLFVYCFRNYKAKQKK
jgi:hypothetical protein